ncbi:hypothetical protein SDC9_114129 [bioreactor metagenome]|uniref:Uncharacterized protein n=1 Tax=bioreactor metagenome TaxID=1076179 RepID=A0A645BPS6_9ZZZZ
MVAFLISQASDARDQRDIGIHFQSQTLLQGRFVFCFAGQIVGREMVFQFWIGLGIIDIVIDSVDDSFDFPAVVPQRPFQPFAEFLRLDFIRIGWADRRDDIREIDATFHEVDVLIILYASFMVDVHACPEDTRQDGRIIDTLETDIVDRDDFTDALVCFNPVVFIHKQDRNHSRMPIIHMDNIRDEVNFFHHFADRQGEETESFGIIHLAIQGRTIEVGLIIDEIIRNAFQF